MGREMDYRENATALAAYRSQIADIRRKMREFQAAVEPEPVADHVFATVDGTARLSELFGTKDDLIVIHNMGTSCPGCTLWADGFNGIYHHLANRAAFVVCGPDPPDVQRRFAAGRVGVSRWSVTWEPISPPIWATGRRAEAGGPVSQSSGAMGIVSCASLTPVFSPATIFARCGTCWICCRTVPPGGRRSSTTREGDGPARRPARSPFYPRYSGVVCNSGNALC